MPTYYNTTPIPFRPAVKIKPLARYYDGFFSCWYIKGRITSRFTGERGQIVYTRASGLYQCQRVIRGTCGKLCWYGAMPDAEFMALPIEPIQGAQR